MEKDIRQPSTIAMEQWAKNKAAVSLGKLGGKVKSDKKSKASRENGKKGGRPKNK